MKRTMIPSAALADGRQETFPKYAEGVRRATLTRGGVHEALFENEADFLLKADPIWSVQ
jgi:hypothetical protein